MIRHSESPALGHTSSFSSMEEAPPPVADLNITFEGAFIQVASIPRFPHIPIASTSSPDPNQVALFQDLETDHDMEYEQVVHDPYDHHLCYADLYLIESIGRMPRV